MIDGLFLEATLMRTYCFFFFFLEGSRNDDRSIEKVRDSVEMHKNIPLEILRRITILRYLSIIKIKHVAFCCIIPCIVLIMLDRGPSPNILFHLIFTTNVETLDYIYNGLCGRLSTGIVTHLTL